MKRKWASSRVDLGYTMLFCIPEVTSVFFSSCDSVLGDSLVFHQGNRGSFHVWLGTWHCSAGNAGESSLITRRVRCLMGFLELQQEPGVYSRIRAGVAIKSFVCSATSGLLSCYDGHLRNLNLAWQDNADNSGGDAGDRVSLSSWPSYIGIPIHFQEESGIVTFWSIEFCVPLEVSKGCEVPCPDEAETYGFL